MQFKVGGDESAVRAKNTLRQLERLASRLAQPQRQGDAVAWAVYAKSDEYPKPVLLSDYVGSMEVIRKRVMEGARREGFKGDFVERMAELGWWIEPLGLTTEPHPTPRGSGVVDEAMVERGCRAICADNGGNPDEPIVYDGTKTVVKDYDGKPVPQWQIHERDVRVALTAALAPTNAKGSGDV